MRDSRRCSRDCSESHIRRLDTGGVQRGQQHSRRDVTGLGSLLQRPAHILPRASYDFFLGPLLAHRHQVRIFDTGVKLRTKTLIASQLSCVPHPSTRAKAGSGMYGRIRQKGDYMTVHCGARCWEGEGTWEGSATRRRQR